MPVATLVDAVLVVFAIETIALALWSWRRRHLRFARLAPTLLSGMCLVLAMRAVAHHAAGSVVAGWLLAAGVAHAIDLTLRLRARR